ncbi:MAG: M1 family metallopeptidase, partial [Flavobacteriales bacterium]
SKGRKTTPVEGGRFTGDPTNGCEINKVRLEGEKPEYMINDTRMRIDLEKPLKEGEEREIKINFAFDIPEYGADRMGRLETENGWIYELAQWYPRMCVYDDLNGWNIMPYLGTGEFYLEYGDFQLNITAPAEHIVASSGELQNPGEVLPDKLEERYEKAQNSEKTVHIIKEKEVGNIDKTRPKNNGTLTWKYEIQNARDVAWASSKGFIWDAAKAKMPSGRSVTAMSFYPKESNGDTAWGRSTEYVKASIEHYSKKWYEYPYSTASNIAGVVGGMEYPSITFCNWKATESGLWGVTDHEFGHTWFPMIVGTNERRYVWMDEGMNTFINHYSTLSFNDGEYTADYEKNRLRFIETLIDENREPISTYPDVVQSQNLGYTAYFKPGYGLILLREFILGENRFDEAFKAYIKRWKYKHPTPLDFFNTMENVAGEELDWFWKGWFYSNKVLDQSVQDVEYVNNKPEKGALITIKNRNGLVMPVKMTIKTKKGNTEKVRLPVEIWKRNDEWTFKYDSSSKINSVIIDKQHKLPDVNPANNYWPMKKFKK